MAPGGEQKGIIPEAQQKYNGLLTAFTEQFKTAGEGSVLWDAFGDLVDLTGAEADREKALQREFRIKREKGSQSYEYAQARSLLSVKEIEQGLISADIRKKGRNTDYDRFFKVVKGFREELAVAYAAVYLSPPAMPDFAVQKGILLIIKNRVNAAFAKKQ